MRRVLPLAGAALLASCAYPNPQRVAFLNGLVGKSEVDLIRAMGVPTRTYDTAGIHFLAYSEHSIETIPGSPGFYGFYGWGGWGGPWYGPGFGGFPPEVVSRQCETTFELKGGIVQHWTLKGNDC